MEGSRPLSEEKGSGSDNDDGDEADDVSDQVADHVKLLCVVKGGPKPALIWAYANFLRRSSRPRPLEEYVRFGRAVHSSPTIFL